jgi:predicted nucleic-acid-binding protein
LKITADTNVLLRALVRDDPRQSPLAEAALREAELVAVTTAVLCEFSWVLTQSYKFPSEEVARAIRTLIRSANVVVDKPAVEAGLAMLDAGGDFADGVIQHQGIALGGGTFVSFDKKGVKLLTRHGKSAEVLR